MSDIELVVKIDEKLYNRMKTYQGLDDTYVAVKHGTPLPKDHGRLIDADEIISEATERMKYPSNHEYMECVIAHMKLAPTIIEADKAESEGKE